MKRLLAVLFMLFLSSCTSSSNNLTLLDIALSQVTNEKVTINDQYSDMYGKPYYVKDFDYCPIDKAEINRYEETYEEVVGELAELYLKINSLNSSDFRVDPDFDKPKFKNVESYYQSIKTVDLFEKNYAKWVNSGFIRCAIFAEESRYLAKISRMHPSLWKGYKDSRKKIFSGSLHNNSRKRLVKITNLHEQLTHYKKVLGELRRKYEREVIDNGYIELSRKYLSEQQHEQTQMIYNSIVNENRLLEQKLKNVVSTLVDSYNWKGKYYTKPTTLNSAAYSYISSRESVPIFSHLRKPSCTVTAILEEGYLLECPSVDMKVALKYDKLLLKGDSAPEMNIIIRGISKASTLLGYEHVLFVEHISQ
ncbi:hypothetical protein [Pseudoalteromonas piscicida]|uniref:hypothetical protein n=1 Tax=Pseudoalteromonas piscicida TaxID=43662 RepID=UPI0005F9EC72|nr:hypothetical protein [Pseudoalteromonas piscicida]KJZ03294.1 hypothetical protein TW73_09110 [Pseudoalteromonas piscicida]